VKGLLFTLGLAYGGAILSLFRPFYGLLIYLCFAVLRPDFLWSWSIPAGNYSRIVAIGLLLGWCAKGCGSWNFGSAKSFVWILIGYWLWVALSAAQAADQSVAWSYVELHSKIYLPVLVGITLIDSVAQLKQLAWTLALSLGYLAYEANLDHLQGGTLIRDEGFGGMDNNSFCIAMAAGAGLSFFLGMHESAWWKRLPALLLAALMVHVTMFGNSRGGMLGVAATGICTVFVIRKRPFDLSLLLLAALAGLRLAGEAVWERFQTAFANAELRDASAESRLSLWMDCWDVMQKNPIFGIGPDHWPLIAESYGWPPGKECHSLWFNAGAELGFVGVALLLGLYSVTIWQLTKVMRTESRLDDSWHGDAARMVIASLVGFMVSASFVSLDALEPPYYICLLGAATVKLAGPLRRRAPSPNLSGEAARLGAFGPAIQTA